MNKVKGPLAKKPMGSAKRSQGGSRAWSNKFGSTDLNTAGSAAGSKNPFKKTRKPRRK